MLTLMNDVDRQLDEKTTQLLRGVGFCLDEGLWEPVLILLYAGIDAFAWLNLPDAADETTGEDFVRWTETYLLPDSGLTCSGREMWGARCGMLHTHTSESRLYRKGAVRRLEYSRDRGLGKPSLVALGVAENDPAVDVDLDKLVAAFRRAVERFKDMLENDEMKRALVAKRVLASYLSRGYMFPPHQRGDDVAP